MSTQDTFDPYRKWLGIPPSEQPPHHYRLLGIGLFEDDADTISIAADRQMAHLRTFQTGPHSALSQKLLNELATARITLLDAKKKAAYDQELRDRLALKSAQGGAGEGRGSPSAQPGSRAAVTQPRSPSSRPSAGQGRGPTKSPVTSVPTHGDAPLEAFNQRHAARKRTSSDRAVWFGVAVAGVLFAAVVYFLWKRADVDPQPRTVAVKESTVLKEKPANKDENKPSISREDDAAKHIEEASGGASITSDGSKGDGEEKGADVNSEGTGDASQPVMTSDAATVDVPTVETVPQPSEAPAAVEKPRSLAELANFPERQHLSRPRREPAPEGKALTAATERFTQRYGKDIAGAKTPEARQKIALRIWNEARDGSQSVDVRYVMLDNIGKEAVAQGSVGLSYRVATEVARQFDIDAFALKIKALEAAAKTAQTPEAFAIGTLQALSLADRAALEGKVEVANKAAGQAGIFARKTKEKDLISQSDRRKSGLRDQSTRNAAYKKALTELKRSPDDAAANLVAGKYEMLVLGNLREAISKLAAANDPRFAEVAQLEAAVRLDLTQCATLATAWWRAAMDEADAFYQPLCQLQAKYWYLRARKLGRAGELPTDVAEQLKDLPGYPLSRLVPGVAARYYEGADFQRQRLERTESTIDFFYGQGSPDPAVPTNFFSARWTGFIKPPVTGRYLFVTHTNDSVRLWIDGKQVLNRWGQNAGWQQVELELSDDPHTFRLEYNETFDVAIAMFGWALAAFPDDKHLQWSPIDALYYDPESPFDVPDLNSR